MTKIFLDLEMNRVDRTQKEIREILRLEIIQIGAVKLDEENNEISSFNRFVKPQYSDHMDPKIERLTHISYDQLADQEDIDAVWAAFLAWCGDDFEIYSWSMSDIEQLENEFGAKKIALCAEAERAFKTWHDYQAEFGAMFPLERAISLKDAVSLAGLDFDGTAHDGLCDARNTADIYRMMQNPVFFKKFKKNVLDLFKPKAFTMADLFNFGDIKFA